LNYQPKWRSFRGIQRKNLITGKLKDLHFSKEEEGKG
jgi:hypothetical protein